MLALLAISVNRNHDFQREKHFVYVQNKKGLALFILYMQAPRHPAGAEGGGDIKAACVGVDVQNLAGKVKSRGELAF